MRHARVCIPAGILRDKWGAHGGNWFLGVKGTGLRPPAGGLDFRPASLSALTGVSLPAFSALPGAKHHVSKVVDFCASEFGLWRGGGSSLTAVRQW